MILKTAKNWLHPNKRGSHPSEDYFDFNARQVDAFSWRMSVWAAGLRSDQVEEFKCHGFIVGMLGWRFLLGEGFISACDWVRTHHVIWLPDWTYLLFSSCNCKGGWVSESVNPLHNFMCVLLALRHCHLQYGESVDTSETRVAVWGEVMKLVTRYS